MSIEVKEIQFENYGNCIQISNGLIDVVVTIDFGPRIVRFGKIGEDNTLYMDLDRKFCNQNEKMDEYYWKGATFQSYGGHRVWISPERMPQTYYPDNEPVVYGIQPDGVTFTPPRQKKNDLQLGMEIILGDNAADIMIVHSATNCSDVRQTRSLWAVTMFPKSGTVIFPVNRGGTEELLPNRTISLWPYTDVRDPRLFIGNRFITVNHDDTDAELKIGTNNVLGWAAYVAQNYTVVKRYVHNEKTAYPDFDSSFETYVCKDFVALETMSPLYGIEPGENIRHVENLSLFRTGSSVHPTDEDAIQKFIDNLGS